MRLTSAPARRGRLSRSTAPEKTEDQAREVIKTWVKNGVLEHYDYENPTTRKQVKGLRVNPAKRPTI